jgi:hypothetical protein
MNCPKCGLQTQSEQKFCRSCGASLQLTTQPLARGATISDRESAPAIIIPADKQRAGRLMLWAFIIMFIGIAIGVIGKKIMHDEIVTVVGVLLSLVGMFLTAYPFLSPSRPKKYSSISSSQGEGLTQSQPSKYLPQPSNIEFVPTITERTTDLLKNSAPTRPRQREDGE